MPEPEDDYWEHWFEVVDAGDQSLRQGDVFRDLVVYWLPDDLPIPEQEEDGLDLDEVEVNLQASRGDWIVLTASCDLEQRRFDHVLLAAVYPANRENLRVPPGADEDELDKYQEVVRQGLAPAKFLLPRYEDIEPAFPRSVAYIRVNVSLPMTYLQENCTSSRLRLRHPFREKFGNWVGRRFSEVGPEDYALVPRIRDNMFPPHVLRAADAEDAYQEGEPAGDDAE